MKDTEFNLWDETWIKVKTEDGEVHDVSLEEVLVHAERYTDIAGELPTQDFAIMRVLLAILHTALFREPPEEPKDAWKDLWDKGHFPAEKILEYKTHWYGRFYLFHPVHPFYQIVDDSYADGKDPKPVEKLNGEMSESANKKRFFLLRSGIEKESLSYEEAARWLIHYNAFDDANLRNPRPYISFLGQICCLFAHGRNLFETLMLNLVLEKAPNEPWNTNKPCWESDSRPLPPKQDKEAYKIDLPDNPAALYTNQFRYMKLKRENGRVIGFTARAGAWFEPKGAFVEQMTYWKKVDAEKKQKPMSNSQKEEDEIDQKQLAKSKKADDKKQDDNKNYVYVPYTYNSPRQMWREFSSILTQTEAKKYDSGLIQWLARIGNDVLNPDYIITFNTLGVKYKGQVPSQIENVFFDSLNLHLSLISEVRADWRKSISDEISICEKIANAVGRLKEGLMRAVGITESGNNKKRFDAGRKAAKEQYYYTIDIPFRRWLLSLDPTAYDETYQEKQAEWRKTAIDCAISLGEKLLHEAGQSAYIGREIIGSNGEMEVCASPKSFNVFMGDINQFRKE